MYQPAAGRLVVRVVKGPHYDERNEETRMLSEARLRLGTDVHKEVEYLSEIPKTRTGKLRFVVSDMDAGEASSALDVRLSDPAPRSM